VNRTIRTLPTLVHDILNLINVGTEHGAERAAKKTANRVERSGERAGVAENDGAGGRRAGTGLSADQLYCLSRSAHMLLDLGAKAEAAKVEPKNIRAEASRISVEPKLQNVWASRSERKKFAAHFSTHNALLCEMD